MTHGSPQSKAWLPEQTSFKKVAHFIVQHENTTGADVRVTSIRVIDVEVMPI